MTPAELDAIRQRLVASKTLRSFTGSVDDMIFGQRAMRDVEALLAEVDRLQAEVNLYLPVVAAAEILKADHQRERDGLRKLLSDAREKLLMEPSFEMLSLTMFEKAVRLLGEKEWITDGRECSRYCIHCNRPDTNGHDDDCDAFGRNGVVTVVRKETAERAARFEAMVREIGYMVTP